MFTRVMLFAFLSMLILCLAGCGGGEEQKQASQTGAAPAAAPAKPAEENVPVYELTKDDITSHEGWTSRNISVLGAKIGDKTNSVDKAFGPVDNSRTLPNTDNEPGYYLTVYQGNGLFVYTVKVTGKIKKMEVYQTFSKKVADEKLKKLLTTGDMKTMHEVLGMEEGAAIENADDMSTEYPYDSRGFRFVRYKLKGATVNALKFIEMKKTS
jgi:hypothetical protein